MSISFEQLKRYAAEGDFPIHVQRSGVTNNGYVICGNSNPKYHYYKIDTLASVKEIGGFSLIGYNGNLRGFAVWNWTISMRMAAKISQSQAEKHHICKDCMAGMPQEQKRIEYWQHKHPNNMIKAYEVKSVCPECHELNYGKEFDSLAVCDWCSCKWVLI